jgi:hypothetical protein
MRKRETLAPPTTLNMTAMRPFEDGGLCGGFEIRTIEAFVERGAGVKTAWGGSGAGCGAAFMGAAGDGKLDVVHLDG